MRKHNTTKNTATSKRWMLTMLVGLFGVSGMAQNFGFFPHHRLHHGMQVRKLQLRMKQKISMQEHPL